jgi:uncharacterized protein YndB with AHSA1/START domain
MRAQVVFTEFFEPYPDTGPAVTAELTEDGGKTRMVATVVYPSREVRDMVRATGMARGAVLSYDRLEEITRGLQR